MKTQSKVEALIRELKKQSNPKNLEGMARVGIRPDKALGTKLPVLRKTARELRKDHALAEGLWKAGYRETRILASMVDEPDRVTGGQMEAWAADFDYWEICDQCCMNLFYRLPEAYSKAAAW